MSPQVAVPAEELTTAKTTYLGKSWRSDVSKAGRQARESLLEGQYLLQARASASSTELGGSR